MKFKKKNILLYAALVIVVCVAGAFLIKGNDSAEVKHDLSYLDGVSAYEIETEYCKLYFPEVYKENLEIEYTEDSGYKVEFYAKVEDKAPKHIFDICFNSDDGDLLGYIDDKENEEIINLSVDVKNLEFDDSWTQDEMDQVYAMQEEQNFVIDSLTKIENYVVPQTK